MDGFNSELDGTYSRAATDVAYSWPLYIKDDNANIQIQRAVESSAARSLWAGVNNGDIEWAALITNCGTQPYDILNCGYEIAGNIQDDAGEFGAATIRANCITTPAPTTTTTQQPTDSPISPAPTTNLPTGVPTTDYPTYGESTTPAPISDNNSSNGAFSLKDTIQFVSFFVLFILFSIIV